jgi:drug/metabolite transporter (DMT)-like permease
VRGAFWMTVSAAAFSVMAAMIRPASEGLHPFQVVFFRNVLGLAMMAPFIFRSGFGVLRTTRLPLHLLRALSFLGGMVTWFWALPHIPLVDAITLYFFSPILITILAALVLRERVRIRRWTAVAVGFTGALVVLRPGISTVDWPQLLVLANACFWSLSAIVMRQVARTDSATTIVAHMFLWVTPLSAIPAFIVWQDPPLTSMLWVLGVAVTSTCGHLALARAFTYSEASVIMPFDYTQLLFAALIGYFIFHEVPDLATFAGAVLIIGSAGYIAQREAVQARTARAGGAVP